MNILQLSKYLDELLDIHSIKDSDKAVNGLQVENTGAIKKVGLAVDLCMATINMAVEKNCDMMFVHHGMFWDGLQPVTGKRFEKLAAILCLTLPFLRYSRCVLRNSRGALLSNLWCVV